MELGIVAAHTARVRRWDIRFLKLAKHVAGWSKDPRTKTGAVITDSQMRVLSLGFNGLPQGIKDLPERLRNRELKAQLILHCERNAILFAQRPLKGCTLYTWPFMSCSVCAVEVVQSGISRHVAPYCDDRPWIDLSTQIFYEAGVELIILESIRI